MANQAWDAWVQGSNLAREQGLAAMQQRASAIQQAGALQALQESTAAREAVAKLGPNASSEDVIKALRPHVAPDKLIGLMQASENQRLNRDSRSQIALANLDAHRKQFYDSLEVRRKLGEDANALRAEAMNFDQQYKAERLKYDTGATVAPTYTPPTPMAAPPASPAPMQPPPQPAPAMAPRPSGPAPVQPPPAAAEVPSVVPSTFATLSQAQSGGLEGRFPPVGVEPTPATGYNQTIPPAATPGPAAAPAPAAPPPAVPAVPAEPQMPAIIANAPKRVQDKWRADQAKASMSATGGNYITPENAHLHGEEFLKTLPPALQNNVSSLIEYKIPATTFSARSQGERSMMTALARQVDPNFDANKYPARQAVMKGFMAGVEARNITSNNMAISHLGTFYELGQAIQNGDVKIFNAVKNRLASELGRPELNNMQMSSQAVGEELMRVFRQVNASESEAKQFQERLGTSSSPDQIKGAVSTAVDLMKGRLDSLNDQWKRGMETEKDFPNIVSPHAQEVLQKMGLKGRLGGTQTAGGPTPAPEMAIQYLKAHPETKDAFKAKFGYLP